MDNMTASQSTSAGTNPPQLNALSAAAKVVSVQIGGNDKRLLASGPVRVLRRPVPA
jgi:hypothetical protein